MERALESTNFFAFTTAIMRSRGEYETQGKAVFGTLNKYRPELAEKIKGTDADPSNSKDERDPCWDKLNKFLQDNWRNKEDK